MSEKNAIAKPVPESFQIPQTVTTAVERKEIRQFINMRLGQIKERLDRIYRFNRDSFVDGTLDKEKKQLMNDGKFIQLVSDYNQDNKRIKALLAEKDTITQELERLCDKKQSASDRIEDFAKKNPGFSYTSARYGSIIDRHAGTELESGELIDEGKITDRLKSEFDSKNTPQLEERNRQLQYVREKVEERLLFGKREEIQHLFCELERMNAMVEGELVSLGISQGFPAIE